MEKVLNQEQIDSIVRAALGKSGGGHTSAVVQPWNVRQVGQIGQRQLEAISSLHENFAGNLTQSVAAYLRLAFTAALVSAEHLSYGEVLQRVPEVTYLATAKLLPVDTSILLQLDLAVAFPLIDVLLGGEGKGVAPERHITAIEEQILETVTRIICRELESAWQVLSLKFEFDARQSAPQVQHLMAAEEKTLSLSFEIKVGEHRGTLNLVFPAAVSNALLRKMSAEWGQTKRRQQTESGRKMREHLLVCPFPIELSMRLPGVAMHDLLAMTPGSVLTLGCPVSQPVSLRITGRDLFATRMARHGPVRAAQILARSAAQPGRRPPL
jgi:flagellar motor switch protein FliM